MNIFVDIDNTICKTNNDDGINKYNNSVPIRERIDAINKLYDSDKYHITYWTARGKQSGSDYMLFTVDQLRKWGCKYHCLSMTKPSYDLYIDDKSVNADDFWNSKSSININTLLDTLHTSSHKSDNEACKKISSNIVHKGWGYEIIFVNNDKYCGKILHFKKGGKFSMHYHLIKTETWYVSSGSFTFKYINTNTADIIIQELNVGDVITNEIGEPHQIICNEEGDIFEVSTTHYDSDSYRVFKGDSQICCNNC